MKSLVLKGSEYFGSILQISVPQHYCGDVSKVAEMTTRFEWQSLTGSHKICLASISKTTMKSWHPFRRKKSRGFFSKYIM